MLGTLELKNKTILFAEDDDTIREQTAQTLSKIFKNVIVCTNGKEAFRAYKEYKPNIVFTDIRMPQMDGLCLAELIRQNDIQTPIVIFTAHSEQKYLLKVANLLISGYLIKPANLDEMILVFLRCNRFLSKNEQTVVDFGNNIVFNMNTRQLTDNGKISELGIREEHLLRLLIDNFPNTVTKEEISEQVWGLEDIGYTSIKNAIARLRVKIGQDKIVSVKGIGWRLVI